MQESYSQPELDEILSAVKARQGWDFRDMDVLRQPVPWDYHEVTLRYLRSTDTVLDIGTGGGERFRALAPAFGTGLGIDPDPEMVRLADGAGPANLSFRVGDHRLGSVVEYVVRDIESLVFWLRALDPAHADLDGPAVVASADAFNRVLDGNVDGRGFLTNEHRYLAIAQLR